MLTVNQHFEKSCVDIMAFSSNAYMYCVVDGIARSCEAKSLLNIDSSLLFVPTLPRALYGRQFLKTVSFIPPEVCSLPLPIRFLK